MPIQATVLRYGGKGDEVENLQKALNKYLSKLDKEFVALAEDGNFGQKTYEALVLAQQKLGVSVDGAYGPATAAALASANSIALAVKKEETAFFRKKTAAKTGAWAHASKNTESNSILLFQNLASAYALLNTVKIKTAEQKQMFAIIKSAMAYCKSNPSASVADLPAKTGVFALYAKEMSKGKISSLAISEYLGIKPNTGSVLMALQEITNKNFEAEKTEMLSLVSKLSDAEKYSLAGGLKEVTAVNGKPMSSLQKNLLRAVLLEIGKTYVVEKAKKLAETRGTEKYTEGVAKGEYKQYGAALANSAYKKNDCFGVYMDMYNDLLKNVGGATFKTMTKDAGKLEKGDIVQLTPSIVTTDNKYKGAFPGEEHIGLKTHTFMVADTSKVNADTSKVAVRVDFGMAGWHETYEKSNLAYTPQPGTKVTVYVIS